VLVIQVLSEFIHWFSANVPGCYWFCYVEVWAFTILYEGSFSKIWYKISGGRRTWTI